MPQNHRLWTCLLHGKGDQGQDIIEWDSSLHGTRSNQRTVCHVCVGHVERRGDLVHDGRKF